MSVQNAQLIEALSDIIGKLATGKLSVHDADISYQMGSIETVSSAPYGQPTKVKTGPANIELRLVMQERP